MRQTRGVGGSKFRTYNYRFLRGKKRVGNVILMILVTLGGKAFRGGDAYLSIGCTVHAERMSVRGKSLLFIR